MTLHTRRNFSFLFGQYERGPCSGRLLAQRADAHFHAGEVPAVFTAGSQYYSLCVYAKDIQEAKHMIAFLLVNDLRNLGDMRHTDPPQEWMWAERLSPDLLVHLQTLHARAQQCCDFVAPTAKRRARQSSRYAPSPLVRTVQLGTLF